MAVHVQSSELSLQIQSRHRRLYQSLSRTCSAAAAKLCGRASSSDPHAPSKHLEPVEQQLLPSRGSDVRPQQSAQHADPTPYMMRARSQRGTPAQPSAAAPPAATPAPDMLRVPATRPLSDLGSRSMATAAADAAAGPPCTPAAPPCAPAAPPCASAAPPCASATAAQNPDPQDSAVLSTAPYPIAAAARAVPADDTAIAALPLDVVSVGAAAHSGSNARRSAVVKRAAVGTKTLRTPSPTACAQAHTRTGTGPEHPPHTHGASQIARGMPHAIPG